MNVVSSASVVAGGVIATITVTGVDDPVADNIRHPTMAMSRMPKNSHASLLCAELGDVVGEMIVVTNSPAVF